MHRCSDEEKANLVGFDLGYMSNLCIIFITKK